MADGRVARGADARQAHQVLVAFLGQLALGIVEVTCDLADGLAVVVQHGLGLHAAPVVMRERIAEFVMIVGPRHTAGLQKADCGIQAAAVVRGTAGRYTPLLELALAKPSCVNWARPSPV